jgi:hypothetical protein
MVEKTECGVRSLSKNCLFSLFDFNETPRFHFMGALKNLSGKRGVCGNKCLFCLSVRFYFKRHFVTKKSTCDVILIYLAFTPVRLTVANFSSYPRRYYTHLVNRE